MISLVSFLGLCLLAETVLADVDEAPVSVVDYRFAGPDEFMQFLRGRNEDWQAVLPMR